MEKINGPERLLENINSILKGRDHVTGNTKNGVCSVNKAPVGYAISLMGPGHEGIQTNFLIDNEGNIISSNAEKPAKLVDGIPGSIEEHEYRSVTVSVDDLMATFRENTKIMGTNSPEGSWDPQDNARKLRESLGLAADATQEEVKRVMSEDNARKLRESQK